MLCFRAYHQVQLNICLCPQDYVLGDREGEVGLLLKAGLHEVDMVKRRMQPCYWPGTLHASSEALGMWTKAPAMLP